MKKVYFLSVFLFGSIVANAQNLKWDWSRTVGTTSSEYFQNAVTDSKGSIYVLGNYQSPTLSIGNVSLVNAGGMDVLLVKYDTLGNVIWAKSFGGTLNDYGADITTDKTGNILITGSFKGSVSFGSVTLLSDSQTVFIAKLNTSGTVLWAKSFTGNNDNDGEVICADNQNNIYIAGGFTSRPFVIEGTLLDSTHYFNGYYCKLDSNGNKIWAKKMWAAGPTSFTNIQCYNNSNALLISAQYQDRINFNPSSIIGLSSPSGYSEQALATIDTNGNYISQYWGQIRGTSGKTAISPTDFNYECGFRTYVSLANPDAYIKKDAQVAIATKISSNSFSGMADVVVSRAGRVFGVGKNGGSNNYGLGFTILGPDSHLAVSVWETDTLLQTKNIIYSNQTNSSLNYLPRSIAIDTVTNALYICGSVIKNGVDSMIQFGNNTHVVKGQYDAFLAKISTNNISPLSLSVSNAQACQGTQVAIGSAAGAMGGTPPYTYSWSPTTNLLNPSAPYTTTTANTNTNYTLTVTDAASNSVSQVVSVSVNPSGISTPTITANGPLTLCPGQQVTLTSSPAASYSWNNGATTQSITVSSAMGYVVTVSNGSGCTANSTPTFVTLASIPNTPIINPSGPLQFCQGNSVSLFATGASAYLWSTGETGYSINVNSSGNYSVKIANAAGCWSDWSNPTSVTVFPLPPTPVITSSVAAGNNGIVELCQGSSTVLTSTTANNYDWTNGSSTQSITVSTGGGYSVRTQSSQGCWSAYSNNIAVSVTPVPNPPTIMASGALQFCEGSDVTLTASGTGNQFTWNNGQASPVITVNTSGTFTATTTSPAGCTSQPSQPVTVTVNTNPPVPVITQSGNVLSSSAATGNQWYLNNEIITGATGQTYTYSTPGDYSVTVTNANGCSSASAQYTAQFTNGTTTILQNGDAFLHRVTPNPVNSQATLHYRLQHAASVSIHLISLNGTRVVELLPTSNKPAGSYDVDITRILHRILSGVYIVQYRINGENVTERIVITR